jgi:hypothetical protein
MLKYVVFAIYHIFRILNVGVRKPVTTTHLIQLSKTCRCEGYVGSEVCQLPRLYATSAIESKYNPAVLQNSIC